MWDMVPNEDTFSNSFTAFDFNMDGLLDLVICDQATMKIVNGSGKSHITHNDTVAMYVLSTFPYSETTIMQYPVIADVDADGSAEIVSVGSSKLNIFKSSGQPWAPARPVWNQYMYNVTNINKDLTVPTTLFNNATAFTDPQGVTHRPFNNFLQQATTLDQYGRPFALLANLTISSTPSVEFEGDEVLAAIEVCNTGELAFSPPMYVSIYSSSGDLVQTEEFAQGLLPGECTTLNLSISQANLKQFNSPYPLCIAVNDNGRVPPNMADCRPSATRRTTTPVSMDGHARWMSPMSSHPTATGSTTCLSPSWRETSSSWRWRSSTVGERGFTDRRARNL